jgi:hypothetical protein
MPVRASVEERIARYEALAEECRRKAEEVHHGFLRDQYLHIASQWQELADSLKKRPFL